LGSVALARILLLPFAGENGGEAIARVAQEIREKHQGAQVAVLFDDDDEDEQHDAAPEASRDDDAEEDEDY